MLQVGYVAITIICQVKIRNILLPTSDFSFTCYALKVLRYASENVFVPLTVGGGIRDYTDANGRYGLGVVVAQSCSSFTFHLPCELSFPKIPQFFCFLTISSDFNG